MEQEPLFLYITQSVTLFLLIWSEYLGATPKYKSNSVAQLLMCGLGIRNPHHIPPTNTPPVGTPSSINVIV